MTSEPKLDKTALFPLGRPQYPGVNMRLRIFEQRYLKLVKDSMSNGTPFGIVPIVRGREVGGTPEFFQWGTLVNIVDFDRQPDGLLGITITGDRRFKVLDHSVEADGLIVAEIEVAPPEGDEETGENEEDLVKLLDDLVSGLNADELFPQTAPGLAALSWRLASLLPLPDDVKITLLKENDPHIRLDIIRECLVDLAASEKPVN